MKCVGVRHKPEHPNLFWFEVPESISSIVQIGTQVMCVTRKGVTTGVVAAMIEGIDGDDLAESFGEHYPFKRIIAAKKDFELSDIHIPWEISTSSPSPSKIAKRVNEFYTTGGFKTSTICNPDGTLQDGYTAYLVAKMFGHETLPAFCVVSDE